VTIIITKLTLSLEFKAASDPFCTNTMYDEAEEELLAKWVAGDNTTFKLLLNVLSTSSIAHLHFLGYNILG
jgi:hypothetical protein